MKYFLIKLTFLLALFSSLFIFSEPVFATNDLQNQIDTADQQIVILNKQIADYQTKLNQAGAEKKTLQSAISGLDLQKNKVEAQIAVTQHQIKATGLQIEQLGSQINDAKGVITMYKDDVARSLREINQSESEFFIYQLLTANSLADFWQDVGDNLRLQNAFQQNIRNLQDQKTKLTTQQDVSEQKKEALGVQNEALAAQKQSLASTVKAKNQLLAETKNNELNYQKLLASAKAQLRSFSDFTKNAGGAKLLGHQTTCDNWGCYYNQRDSSWGAQSLNGTEYTLASDGCLVTSIAMVITHFGYQNVTPASINANPDNFAAYYPAFLMKTVTVGNVSATRISAAVDGTLAAGKPIIVGLKVGGGTHFVVLINGQKGNYTMRDPYISNGKDINFSDHYTVKEIYSIETVTVRG